MSVSSLPCDVLDHLAGYIPVAANYARLRQTCTWCYKSISGIVPATLVTLRTVVRTQTGSRWRDPKYARFEGKLDRETIDFIRWHSRNYREIFGRFLERLSTEDFSRKLSSRRISELWYIGLDEDWVDTVRRLTPLVPSARREMQRSTHYIKSWNMMQFFIKCDINLKADAPGTLKRILRMPNRSDAMRMFEYLAITRCFEPSGDLIEVILSAECDATHEVRIEIIRRILEKMNPAAAWIDRAAENGNVGVINHLRQQAIGLDLNYCLRTHTEEAEDLKPDFLRYLVSVGADINHKHAGESFLSFFIGTRGTHDIMHLLELGASMESNKLVDFFLRAVLDEKYETCEKLLRLGFDINARSRCKYAAIHSVLDYSPDSDKPLLWLIRHGADIDRRGGYYRRPPLLQLLTEKNNRGKELRWTFIQRLLLEGADPRIRDSRRRNAFDYGGDHIVKFLRGCVGYFCVGH
jgi:hypothetical protein